MSADKNHKSSIRQFLQSTTANGFNKVDIYRNKLPLKVIWIIIILISNAGFAYHLSILGFYYLSVPLATKYQLSTEDKQFYPITICKSDFFFYQNNLTRSIYQYYDNKTINDTKSLIKRFYNDLNITEIDIEQYSLFYLSLKEEVLSSIYTPLLTCENPGSDDCPQYHKSPLFIYNDKLCGTITFNDSALTSYNQIYIHHFDISMIQLRRLSSSWPKLKSFFSVLIHDKNTVPSGTSFDIFSVSGKFRIDLNKRKTVFESTRKRACQSSNISVNLIYLTGESYEYKYEKKLCELLLLQDDIWKQCGCISERLFISIKYKNVIENHDNLCYFIPKSLIITPINETKRLLFINRYNCINKIIQESTAKYQTQCSINCEQMRFEGNGIMVDKSSVLTEYHKKLMNNVKDNYLRAYYIPRECQLPFPVFKIVCDSMRRQILSININFGLELENLNEISIYGLVNLISDIGGILGLYAGMSCLTIIEFIDFIIIGRTNEIIKKTASIKKK